MQYFKTHKRKQKDDAICNTPETHKDPVLMHNGNAMCNTPETMCNGNTQTNLTHNENTLTNRMNEKSWKREKFICRICRITCRSSSALKQHLQGRKHLNIIKSWKREKFICRICRITCRSSSALKQHLQGRKHLNIIIERATANLYSDVIINDKIIKDNSPISITGVSVQENRQVQMSCLSQKRLHIKANINSEVAAPLNTIIYISAKKEKHNHNLLNNDIFLQIEKVRTDPAFAKIPHNTVGRKYFHIQINYYFKLFL